ncbi:MAG: hypothetical protein CMF70_04145 [Magnetovibrio sp.]|nr:hypothetical protein [Magnetovibrio sp.]|tara:strand:+ start:489 stop:689 length:201 start_codon:yes stop_codon:yes gene_type:complete
MGTISVQKSAGQGVESGIFLFKITFLLNRSKQPAFRETFLPYQVNTLLQLIYYFSSRIYFAASIAI